MGFYTDLLWGTDAFCFHLPFTYCNQFSFSTFCWALSVCLKQRELKVVDTPLLPWDGKECIKTLPEGKEGSWEWWRGWRCRCLERGGACLSWQLPNPEALRASCPRCSKQYFLSTAVDAIKLCSLCGEEWRDICRIFFFLHQFLYLIGSWGGEVGKKAFLISVAGLPSLGRK